MKKSCKDHLGNTYRSISAMCKEYNINLSTYKSRIRRGYSIEDSLCAEKHSEIVRANNAKENNAKAHNKCTDHLGNKYRSIHAMCKAYGISSSTYSYRRKAGYSIGESLGVEPKHVENKDGIKCTDHLGNTFSSEAAMCRYWGVDSTLYCKRKKAGCNIKQSLFGVNYIEDHLGNCYNSYSDVAKAYGINRRTLINRLNNGYTFEQALSCEVKCRDYLGNPFKSENDMCEAYGVNYNTYMARKKSGRSLEECLSNDKLMYKGTNKCVDHLGNIFRSEFEMCKAHGVNYYTYKTRKIKGHSLEECLCNENMHKKRK